jgi:Gametolysin peptidase M11
VTKVVSHTAEYSKWTCLVDPVDYDGRANHQLKIIGLTDAEIAGLVSGATYMTAVGALIEEGTVDVSGVADKTFYTPPDKSNGASKVLGTRKVLAVRVKSADGANPKSVAELKDNIFTDSINLAERYASCSYNQLTMEAFSGTMNNVAISGGVYEVTISQNTASRKPEDVERWVMDKLNSNLGSNFMSQIQHLMIFVPNNIPRFQAYGYFPGKVSVFDGFIASYASNYFVHEVGHNLNLDHSGSAFPGEATKEYGDGACYLCDMPIISHHRSQLLVPWGSGLTRMTTRCVLILQNYGRWAGLMINRLN